MKLRIIAPAVLLAALVVLLMPTLGFTFRGKLFPLVVLIPLMALLCVQLIRELRAVEPSEEIASGPVGQGMAFFWMGMFLAIFYLMGFLVGMPLFVLLYIKSRGFGWVKATASGVVALAITAGFIWGMGQFAFYEGLVFELLGEMTP